MRTPGLLQLDDVPAVPAAVIFPGLCGKRLDSDPFRMPSLSKCIEMI